MAQFVAGLALLGFTTWLLNRWLDLFGPENFYSAAFVWIGLMIVIAWIYDLRQAKLRRSSAENQPDRISPEN